MLRVPAEVRERWRAARALRKLARRLDRALWHHAGYDGSRLRDFPRDYVGDDIYSQADRLLTALEYRASQLMRDVESPC